MDRRTFCLDIIQESLRTKIPVGTICKQRGKSIFYVSDLIKDLKKKKKITEQEDQILREYSEYSAAYKIWQNHGANNVNKEKTKQEPKSTFNEGSGIGSEFDTLTQEEKEWQAYDAETDDKYDDRSIGKGLRENLSDFVIDEATGQPLVLPTGDNLPKITRYYYKILIRDEHPLEGHLTRDEMTRIYRLYSSLDGAGLTIRSVSREFPFLTFRDFKRILRAFNITKQSIPIAPHIIEETSKDKIVELVFRGKENDVLKKMDLDRGRQMEKILNETQRELVELKKSREDMKDIFSKLVIPDVEPFKIKTQDVKQSRALLVYLSDQHVGAKTDDESIYKNDYDDRIFAERMNKVLEKIQYNYKLFGRLDKIFILNCGDCLDGFNAQTTRGGHALPQNLSNRQQFTVYVEVMLKFFDTLHKMNVANNIEFISVGDSNHGGDAEYIANKSLEYIAEHRYPDMNVRVFEKFIEHFTYGNHTFIVTHGKDKEDMKFGLPLILNDKNQVWIDFYINSNRINTPTINVIKGDLHQSASQFGKRFRYKNVSSLYGASKWIHTNFGGTLPAVDYEIVEKDVDTYEAIIEGRIYF